MFQTTPYIWFLVVSRKLNTLLHQDLLLLNFPVTLIPFLLLPGGPSVGKPFLMIQVGGQKHQLWERTSPWILGRIKKKRKDWEMEPNLRDGISGDIYHTVMGIPTSNKKTSPCFPLLHWKNQRTMPQIKITQNMVTKRSLCLCGLPKVFDQNGPLLATVIRCCWWNALEISWKSEMLPEISETPFLNPHYKEF